MPDFLQVRGHIRWMMDTDTLEKNEFLIYLYRDIQLCQVEQAVRPYISFEMTHSVGYSPYSQSPTGGTKFSLLASKYWEVHIFQLLFRFIIGFFNSVQVAYITGAMHRIFLTF